jgi:hypothetical protein
MQYEIIHFPESQYYRINVTGRLRDADAVQIHEDILRVTEAHLDACFLLDITQLEGRLNVFESMQAAHSVARGIVGKIRKVAILDDVVNRTSAIIAQAVMANRGLKVKFFFDVEMAVRWLRE